jgi:hypothetical protein
MAEDRYDYYNRYIEENPTVEDTEALLTLDLINYFSDRGEYERLLAPQPYTYADTTPHTIQELILTLQESGGNPYIFMGGTEPEETINYYTKGRPGSRASFRQDKTRYINPDTGERFTKKQYDFLKEESEFETFLKANQDVEVYREMLEKKRTDIPELEYFDKLREVFPEERVDTLVINSPFAERLREGSGEERFLRGSQAGGRHPLESYIAELAHARQFSIDDLDYIDYINKRVTKEHDRFGGAGKYRNPYTIEYEAHDIIEPHYWDYLEGFLKGDSPELNINVPSYQYYQEGVEGPENYTKVLNE